MSHVTRTFTKVLLAAMALVLVLGAIPAMAATPNMRPAINLGPLSHREELRATVHAGARLAHIELRMDNKAVQPWVKSHANWTYTVSYPLKKLSTGTHTAKLTVRNEKNHTTQRQWQFQKLAQLALTIDRSSVLPNERVTLTGQGFTPGAAITVGMDGQNTGVGGNYGKAIADGSGAFTVQVSLERFPNGSPLHAGTVTLIAHNSDGSERASADVRILPDPRIALDRNSIKAGDTVRVTGAGFTPGVGISISLGAPNTGAGGNYGMVVTDSAGTFTMSLRPMQLPDGSPLFAGSVILVAHTADSAEKATVPLQVLADPAISLNKSAIKAGESVTVTGQGFTPGASISIALGGANTEASGSYGSTVADAVGRFSLDVTLTRYPDGSSLTPGAIVLLAHTADFSQKASVQLRILANPTIALDRAIIQPGDRTTVTGQGFTPGSSISISMGSVNTGAAGNYGTANVNVNGAFSLVVMPERYPNGLPLGAGPIVLVAHNAAWDETASAQLQILTLTASPTVYGLGDPIMLRGEGFQPGAALILSVALSGAAPSGNYGSATVDAGGRFVLATKLTQYPGGSPLRAGPLTLLVHDYPWRTQAAVQIQVVDRMPAAPSDLRITSLTKGTTSAQPTTAGLQWRDNASNETSFTVQASFTHMNGGTDTQTWRVPADTTTTTLSFVAGGINPITRACFTVTAHNAQGDSPSSNQACATL